MLRKDSGPTHECYIGDHWVLWYQSSNTYSVVDGDFKPLLDLFLKSTTLKDFSSNLRSFTSRGYNMKSVSIHEDIGKYLASCNKQASEITIKNTPLDGTKKNISKHFRSNSRTFEINFDCELVLKTIFPALAHLEIKPVVSADTIFDIYLKDEHLHLFKNAVLKTCVPKLDYHLLQGKFIMELLCSIHEKDESDWISTFHGCTIADGTSAALLVGASGRGKSTLSALLAASGFELVADDVSPLRSKNLRLYNNPAAISIKAGAFDVLKPLIPRFEDLPQVQFNSAKGIIKYVPFPKPKHNSYTCKSIILVNYSSKAETLLESISVAKVLETLIPDSWISPNPLHAKQFLAWLESLSFYELTYSNTASAITEISQIFKDQKLN